MKTKPKKCKGIGKAKGFEGCGEVVYYRRYGLCGGCLVKWIDNTDEGKEHFKKVRNISKKKVQQEDKKKLREQKQSIRSKSYYEKQLQTEVNKIVRLIDFDKGCISCSHGIDKFTRQAHAGHKKSVGSNPTLRYHLDNIHKQCSICNAQLGGNPHEYYKGLVKRYGKEYADSVETLSAKYKRLNLTVNELKDIITVARRIVREIEQGKDYTREEVNNQLGIYKK